MQVSLRKANAIQVAINEALKGLDFKTEVSINEFQKPEDVIVSANQAFHDNMERRAALIQALYDIRKSVAQANSANDIDNKLADIALLEKGMSFLAPIVKTQERLAPEVIQGKLEKLANRTEESYYQKNEVETSIFTKGDLDALRRLSVKTKKQKQKLQDELLELNVRTTIDLSEQAVATLTAEDIL